MDDLIGRIVVPTEISQGTDGKLYINSGYAKWCAAVSIEIDNLVQWR